MLMIIVGRGHRGGRCRAGRSPGRRPEAPIITINRIDIITINRTAIITINKNSYDVY